MKENEKPIEYFFRMLVEGRLSFSELTKVYVLYLEQLNKKNREQIVEDTTLLSVFHEPKLWMGTKKDLNRRLIKAIDAGDVFPKLDKSEKGKE